MLAQKWKGGQGVSNFIRYFTAAQITSLICLYASKQDPLWVDLETFAPLCPPFSHLPSGLDLLL